jgi:hypothetical protein
VDKREPRAAAASLGPARDDLELNHICLPTVLRPAPGSW